ncbi:DUF4105 domain-containing protein [Ochrobactrum vermis]|uniref:DUF4105 domain-containing protein n=1 Tax=Ochrobactrum vermis TaxID=1827297 RepID=A0ABU8PHC5_9HYPH|nr:DUF4105 domain-containing protein [Ochrobactrum vermis]PQZ25271.1 hypothetical protein CQZ93_14175 [Ochrobactrum vermis]
MINIVVFSVWIFGSAIFSLLAGCAIWFHLRTIKRFKIGAMAAIALIFILQTVAIASSRLGSPLTFAAAMAFVIFVMGVMLWWITMQPSLTREWADDVAHTAMVDLRDKHISVHNIRDFDWHDGGGYDARWKSETYSLNEIEGVEVILSYWAHPAIAHTLVSFGFQDGRHLVFSAEIRKKRGQEFSTIGGFFRNYELAMVASEERDIVYLRTNVRGERVYRYPINVEPALIREMLLCYADKANDLALNPSFYNTLTSNCTTVVFDLVRALEPAFPFDYRVLLSGYLPEFLYDHNLLGNSDLPFAEVKNKALIRPVLVDEYARFSTIIRNRPEVS